MPIIQLKRRETSGNKNVTLQAGEPYYNLKDKKLYIGTKDNESLEGRRHIAEIWMRTSIRGDRVSVGVESLPFTLSSR